MNFFNSIIIIWKKLCLAIIGITVLSLLSACEVFKWDPADARTVSPNADERARKNVEEGKGFSIMGSLGSGGTTSYQFASSNPMWRATLEILDFLPLANVDYSGGIITTDWYNEGTASDESIKITVRFLTNEPPLATQTGYLQKKRCDVQQKCSVKKISSVLENELQAAILTKAAILEKNMNKKKLKRPKKNS